MAFRRTTPAAGTILRNPEQHENWIRDVESRLAKVEKRTSTESVSSQQRAPIASKPPYAGFNVSGAQGKGRWQVTIRLPELGNMAGSGRTSPKPLYHRVSYSPDATFRSGVTKLDPSPQTHFSIIEDPNQVLYFKLESSHDLVNFNLPQYAQAQG